MWKPKNPLQMYWILFKKCLVTAIEKESFLYGHNSELKTQYPKYDRLDFIAKISVRFNFFQGKNVLTFVAVNIILFWKESRDSKLMS